LNGWAWHAYWLLAALLHCFFILGLARSRMEEPANEF